MSTDKDNNNNNQTPAGQMAAYLVIPFILAVSPIVGWLIGHALDKWLGTPPFFMFVFLVFGFAAGVRETYRIIKRFGNGS